MDHKKGIQLRERTLVLYTEGRCARVVRIDKIDMVEFVDVELRIFTAHGDFYATFHTVEGAEQMCRDIALRMEGRELPPSALFDPQEVCSVREPDEIAPHRPMEGGAAEAALKEVW